MSLHFHVLTGPASTVPQTDVVYDDYVESLYGFLGMGRALFKDLAGSDEDQTIEQALEATAHGEARGAYIGPPSLMVYWFRCEDETHNVASWN